MGITRLAVPPPWSVFALFNHNIVQPGQLSAWHAEDNMGFPAICVNIGIVSTVIKLEFQTVFPGTPITRVTYDNATGNAFNVVLQPLFTGKDFPVT